MHAKRDDIIVQLKEDILRLQGFKKIATNVENQVKLGPIDKNFPQGCFPLAAMHEFINEKIECSASTKGFIGFIISFLMQKGDVCVWIGSAASVFPPALKYFGVEPDKVIFINVQKDKDKLWVLEEALKCEGLAAVVGEIKEISFTESRRLQIAIEKSQVTGFIIRNQPRNINVTTCVSRWRISPLPSSSENGLPGVGFPCWNVELLKIRNGKPGSWQMEWSNDQLHILSNPVELIIHAEERKTG